MPGKNNEKRKNKLDRRKKGNVINAIHAAALEVFAEHGYAGARVDMIAAQARVNKAMLYYHVGDKQEIYCLVLKELLNNLYTALQSKLATIDSHQEKLKTFIRTIARYAHEHPQLPKIMLREIAGGGVNLPDDVLREMGNVFKIVKGILHSGTGAGVFRNVDPLKTHVMIVGSNVLLAINAPLRKRLAQLEGITTDTKDSPERNAEHIINVVMNGIAKQGD